MGTEYSISMTFSDGSLTEVEQAVCSSERQADERQLEVMQERAFLGFVLTGVTFMRSRTRKLDKNATMS